VVVECDEDLVEWLFQHLDVSWVRHPIVRGALVFRLDRMADKGRFEIRDLLTSLQGSEGASLVTEAAADERKIPNQKAQLADIVLRLRNLYIDAELRVLSQQQGGEDFDEMAQAAHVLELQRTKRQPLESLPDV
ncbi:hypothetical protein N8612_06280, partial [Verrucomicrobia bacterium]|nr:hypothetical protein [Verrucomicrobiota bacterium]